MRTELLDRLPSHQRAVLEEFHHGHLSAGELSRRLSAAGPGSPDPRAPEDTQSWSSADLEAVDVEVASTIDGARSSESLLKAGRGRHLLALLTLAIVVGTAGAALGAAGVSGGSYRAGDRKAGRASHIRRHAQALRHVAAHQASPAAAPGGPAATPSQARPKHKAQPATHRRSSVRKRPGAGTGGSPATKQPPPPTTSTTPTTTPASSPTTATSPSPTTTSSDQTPTSSQPSASNSATTTSGQTAASSGATSQA